MGILNKCGYLFDICRWHDYNNLQLGWAAGFSKEVDRKGYGDEVTRMTSPTICEKHFFPTFDILIVDFSSGAILASNIQTKIASEKTLP